MEGEMITKKKHPEIYKWLSENVLTFNRFHYIIKDNNIHIVKNHIVLMSNVKEIKYKFNIINGYFNCAYCNDLTSLIGSPTITNRDFVCWGCRNLTSLDGSPKKIGGVFNIGACASLKSLKGFPKYIEGGIVLTNNHFSNHFSNHYVDNKIYYTYVDMWFELLESVTEDEKWEYINNYKDKVDNIRGVPIIPKEIINKYKIDFLLNYK